MQQIEASLEVLQLVRHSPVIPSHGTIEPEQSGRNPKVPQLHRFNDMPETAYRSPNGCAVDRELDASSEQLAHLIPRSSANSRRSKMVGKAVKNA